MKSGLMGIAAACLLTSTSLAASEHVQAKLVADVVATTPGTSFWVAVVLTMEPGWHTYWENPGDAGLQTRVEWKLPVGIIAGPLQWPCPEKIVDSSGAYFCYTNEVWLLVQMTTPLTIRNDSMLQFGCTVKWLACGDACIPGKTNMSFAMPVSGATVVDTRLTNEFSLARPRLPVLDPAYQLSASVSNRDIVLVVTLPETNSPAIEEPFFFPSDGAVLDHAAQQDWTQSGAYLRMHLKASPYATTVPEHLEGVLRLNAHDSIAASTPIEHIHTKE